MKYSEFMKKDSFDLEELITFAYGRLVDDPPPDFDSRLPAPPFLMMDRIISIGADGRKGAIVAEQDIRMDAWYFQCHMPGDPVQPGCLCVDAIWQLLGFYCCWKGGLGGGRALGSEEIIFNGQVRPYNKTVRYEVDVKRFSNLKDSGSSIVIGDGRVFVDDELIMTVKDARAGIFKGIVYPDYPKRSLHARGGIIKREL